MPWPTDFSTDTDVNDHVNVEAFRRALFERVKAATGAVRWPRPNNPFDEGTIGAMSDLGDGLFTLTDSTKHWIINDDDHTDAPRWVDWTDPDVSPLTVPENYDIILNCDDPDLTKQVHVRIENQPVDDEHTVIISTPIDWVTAGWIESVEWLVGKKYAIIKRGGVWWGERWPDQPNDDELWREDNADSVSVITVDVAAWQAGLYAGKTFHRAGMSDATILDNGADWFSVPRYNDPEDPNLPESGQAFEIKDGADVLVTADVGDLRDGITLSSWHLKPSTFLAGDLLIYSSIGRVVRIEELLFATAKLIVFERQEKGVSGAFSIVREGERAWPGRKPWPIHQWYGGATQNYWTHRPPDLIFSDTLIATPGAVTSVRYSSGEDPLFCVDTSFDAFDLDVWSALSEVCSEADKCYSPNLFKTFRALQNLVTSICQSFVPVDDYDGDPGIPTYRPATLFEDAGINFVGRYTGVADGDGDLAISFPAQPVDPHWAMLDPNGVPVNSGVGFASGSFTASGLAAGKTYTLVIALGWSRYVPREFRYAYPRSAFIPDIQTDDFGNKSVVDPPTYEYPGEWIDRDASTSYKRYEPFGFASDGGAAFEDGIRARYVGDNWGDPGVTPNTPVDEDGPLDTLYWRNFWEGKFNKTWRGPYHAKMSGFVEYGGKRWFKSRGIDWWDSPIGAGELRNDTFAATGGTTTTLTLAAKYYTPTPTDEDPFPDPLPDPFWAGDRYVGMMLEVDQTVEDEDEVERTVTYRTPITAVSTTPAGDSPTVSEVTFLPVPAFVIPATFDLAGAQLTAAINVPALTVHAGNAARIYEPAYRRNWWRGRKITITNPDGQTATVRPRWNDRSTLWLPDELDFAIEPGATWKISELEIGGVYQWHEAEDEEDESEWLAAGNNTKNLPLPHLLPANDLNYGPVMAGDYLGQHVYQELYATINLLVWTLTSVAWSSRSAEFEDTPGDVANEISVGVSNSSDNPPDDPSGGIDTRWAELLEAYEDKWENGPYSLVEASAPPYYRFTGNANGVDSAITGGERISCAVVSAPVVGMNREIDVFSYAQIDETDPDEGQTVSATIDSPNITRAYLDAVFDPHGTPMQFRKWVKWLTATPAIDQLSYKTAYLGSPVTYIAPSGTPHGLFTTNPNELGGTTVEKGEVLSGFIVADSHAIVRWDVAGGMEYVAA